MALRPQKPELSQAVSLGRRGGASRPPRLARSSQAVPKASISLAHCARSRARLFRSAGTTDHMASVFACHASHARLSGSSSPIIAEWTTGTIWCGWTAGHWARVAVEGQYGWKEGPVSCERRRTPDLVCVICTRQYHRDQTESARGFRLICLMELVPLAAGGFMLRERGISPAEMTRVKRSLAVRELGLGAWTYRFICSVRHGGDRSKQAAALLGKWVLVPDAGLVGHVAAADDFRYGNGGELVRKRGNVSGFNGCGAVIPLLWRVGPAELDTGAAARRGGIGPSRRRFRHISLASR